MRHKTKLLHNSFYLASIVFTFSSAVAHDLSVSWTSYTHCDRDRKRVINSGILFYYFMTVLWSYILYTRR